MRAVSLWIALLGLGLVAGVTARAEGTAEPVGPPPFDSAETRDPLVGRWSWFNGGTVTIHPAGTLVHDQGNRGTWNIKDRDQQVYTLRWLQGDFVDTVRLSADGQSLAGTNQAGTAISARRISAGPAARPEPPPSPKPGQAPDGTVGPSAARPAPDPTIQQVYQRGLALYAAKDYPAALPLIQQAAWGGHDRAQCVLGNMYLEGLGVPMNKPQAVAWFRQAAAQRNRAAQFQLGVLYARGEGVPRDPATATSLLEASASQGLTEARIYLNRMQAAAAPAAEREADAKQPLVDLVGTVWTGTATFGPGNIAFQFESGGRLAGGGRWGRNGNDVTISTPLYTTPSYAPHYIYDGTIRGGVLSGSVRSTILLEQQQANRPLGIPGGRFSVTRTK